MPNVPASSTYLSDLFDPEVIGDMIDTKLTDAIKFAPLCRIDTTLVGRPGDTITLLSFAYIGDAVTVAEGADIPITQLVESSVEAKVQKVGKGLQFTDESILSGYGDPLSEGIRQIQTAIASKVDNDVITALNSIGAAMTYTAAARTTADDISDALILLGEDIDGDKVLLCSPDTYGGLRKTDGWIPNTEIGASMIVRGAVGMVHGCQVVVTNRLTDTSFIVSPGALALYMKRDTFVETDRDIINKSTVMTADKHYVAYLYDSSKAIKIEEAP
ncbi:putative major head protein, phage associated [Clostridia bacterium]|nr:putative major head protein, phage associated [Clostridia bacterium]